MKNIVNLFARVNHLNKKKYLSEDDNYSEYMIGRYSYGNPKIYKWDNKTKLEIGSFCSIADDVTILLGGEHRIDWISTYPFNILLPEGKNYIGHPSTKGDVIIGNDVWIGTGTLILSGVEIGDGAVIAARSVITKSVYPYCIVGGNPQGIIRKRFTQDQIDELLNIAWWNWPIENIILALPDLLNDNIDRFIAKYKRTKD